MVTRPQIAVRPGPKKLQVTQDNKGPGWSLTCFVSKSGTQVRQHPECIHPEGDKRNMVGWMILFALMAILGAVLTAAGLPAPAAASMQVTSLVFTVLFLITVLTRAIRRGA